MYYTYGLLLIFFNKTNFFFIHFRFSTLYNLPDNFLPSLYNKDFVLNTEEKHLIKDMGYKSFLYLNYIMTGTDPYS